LTGSSPEVRRCNWMGEKKGKGKKFVASARGGHGKTRKGMGVARGDINQGQEPLKEGGNAGVFELAKKKRKKNLCLGPVTKSKKSTPGVEKQPPQGAPHKKKRSKKAGFGETSM